MNSYKKHLIKFYRRILAVRHHCERVKILIEREKDAFDYLPVDAFVGGSALIIRDWSGTPRSHSLHTKLFEKTNAGAYRDQLREISNLTYRSSYAQCYESMESFFKDIIFELSRDSNKYQKVFKGDTHERDSMEGGKILFKAITSEVIGMDKIITARLKLYYELFSVVRHAVVHSSGIIRKSKISCVIPLQNVSQGLFEFIEEGEDMVSIHISHSQLGNLINVMADIGFQVFKQTCTNHDMDWHIFK